MTMIAERCRRTNSATRAIAGFNELRALSRGAPLPAADTDDPQLSFRLARPFRTWDSGRRCLRRAAKRNGCGSSPNSCRRF